MYLHSNAEIRKGMGIFKRKKKTVKNTLMEKFWKYSES